MIAVNQVLTPKVTQGTVSDEAVADPEIPFSNTLDELLEDSMTEFEAEDLLLGELEEGQLMAEQGLGEESILVEENILETLTDDENQIALAVPMAPEFVPDSQTIHDDLTLPSNLCLRIKDEKRVKKEEGS